MRNDFENIGNNDTENPNKHNSPFNPLTAVEISVQRLHKQVDLLQNDQLVHLHGRPHDEVQARVPPVHELVLPLLDDVAHFGLARQDVGCDVAQDALLLRFGVGGEELREADLALAGHEDDEIPAAGGGGLGLDGGVVVVHRCVGMGGWMVGRGRGFSLRRSDR